MANINPYDLNAMAKHLKRKRCCRCEPLSIKISPYDANAITDVIRKLRRRSNDPYNCGGV